MNNCMFALAFFVMSLGPLSALAQNQTSPAHNSHDYSELNKAPSDEQFAKCYGPTWGRFKDRTRPAPGNHEYHSDGASGYVHYFGAAADDPKKYKPVFLHSRLLNLARHSATIAGTGCSTRPVCRHGENARLQGRAYLFLV
jgi:hypothetical protein